MVDRPMITLTVEGLKEAQAMFSAQTIRSALGYMLQRCASGIKTEAWKSVRDKYNVKQADFYSRIKIGKIYRVGPGTEITISISGAKIPLGNFPIRQTMTGVEAQVQKGKWTPYGPRTFQHGRFRERTRRTKKTKAMVGPLKMEKWKQAYVRKGEKRMPVYYLYGPSPVELLGSDWMISNVFNKVLNERGQKEFEQGINYYSGLVKSGSRWSLSGGLHEL